MFNRDHKIKFTLKNPAAPTKRCQPTKIQEPLGRPIQRGCWTPRTLHRPKPRFCRARDMIRKDPSDYLVPNIVDHGTLACNKLISGLKEMAETKKGCLIWYSIQYFELSNNVRNYVDILMQTCLNDDYIMDITTKNLVLLSNTVYYGENIKKQIIFILVWIHQDLVFVASENTDDNSHFYLKYYNHNIIARYYKFVNLLFFRFRIGLDIYCKYKSLAHPALNGLKYFLWEESLESIKVFTRLMQLNYHGLEKWFPWQLKQLVNNVFVAKNKFETKDLEKFRWLSGVVLIIIEGPIFYRTTYNHYLELLGPAWAENVTCPPVQVLERMSDVITEEYQGNFYIDDYDIIRNMFVYLP